MTASVAPSDIETSERAAAKAARREKLASSIRKADRTLTILGLGWLVPLLYMAIGENVASNGRALWRQLGVPLLAIAIFIAAWANLAPRVVTSLGEVPGPVQVWEQAEVLYEDHVVQRQKAADFYDRQEERNAKLVEAGKEDRVKWRTYTGKPSYFDQIWTSLQTVFMGFLFASVIAIPLGIAAGLSENMNAALNPLIQVFKPVSPLAWLPIVTMVVSATYVSDDPWFEKSFINSAITVTLCSLWPTLINTAMGVSSIPKDLTNVGRVLQLGWWTKIRRLVLPSALPFIFTGLRLSLGVGWMVLIAAEMLAQNPGLGKFVWDEFQNGSSSSLAKIMVAVFTIGIIGFLLDRLMLALQTLVSPTTGR